MKQAGPHLHITFKAQQALRKAAILAQGNIADTPHGLVRLPVFILLPRRYLRTGGQHLAVSIFSSAITL